MRVNKRGIDLVKKFEGCVLKAYPDPATGGKPWTIGYGQTGDNVGPHTVWTQAEADDALARTLAITADSVTKLLTTRISDNQFNALVCFAYNVGVANLSSSTLLKRVNEGDFTAAADEFLKWNKAAGKVMAGLTTRRAAEQALFKS